jgi:hypothetical protein
MRVVRPGDEFSDAFDADTLTGVLEAGSSPESFW